MNSTSGMKACSKCGKVKLITAFHLLNGGVEGPDARRRSDCKECHVETMRNYRKTRVEKDGETYLQHERDRVRDYGGANPQADARRAIERARHRALRELKRRYPSEYHELERQFKVEEGVA